jgi:sporulation protein YunB
MRTLRRAQARFRVFRIPGKRAALIALAAAAAICVVAAAFVSRVRPIMEELAKAQSREYVLRAINDAMGDEIIAGGLRYSELVTLEKDETGAVTALVTDMAKINILQSRVSSRVAENIAGLFSADMSVPLGDAFGGVLFSGRGPKIPIRVESVTDVRARLMNDFDSEGINQTRHRITLSIAADIAVLIPGGKTRAEVTSDVAIAETVIVGGVPDVYTRFG